MRLLPLVLLFACASPDDPEVTSPGTGGEPTGTATGTTGTTTGTATGTTAAGCNRTIPFSSPTNGEGQHYYRDRLLMGLSPVPDASEGLELTLVDGDGTTLPGTTLLLTDGLEFVPDQGLLSETDYALSVVGCPSLAISFTTGLLGDPVDPATVTSQSYSIDIATANWIQPAGVGALIPLLGLDAILIGPENADAAYLDLLATVPYAGTTDQDMCIETVTFPSAGFTQNPFFDVGPADFSITANGVTVDLYDAALSGDFAGDGSAIYNGALSGTLDVGALSEVLGSDACSLLSLFSVSCIPCPSGTSDCIEVELEDIVATGGLPALVPLTLAEVYADPMCAYTTGTTP